MILNLVNELSGGQEIKCIDIRLALFKFFEYVSKQEMPVLADNNVLFLEFSPETSRAQFSSNSSAARQ